MASKSIHTSLPIEMLEHPAAPIVVAIPIAVFLVLWVLAVPKHVSPKLRFVDHSLRRTKIPADGGASQIVVFAAKAKSDAADVGDRALTAQRRASDTAIVTQEREAIARNCEAKFVKRYDSAPPDYDWLPKRV